MAHPSLTLHRYKSTVSQVVGDGLMALSGVPMATATFDLVVGLIATKSLGSMQVKGRGERLCLRRPWLAIRTTVLPPLCRRLPAGWRRS